MKFERELVRKLTQEFHSAGNEKDALAMHAYMKGIAPFFGVRTIPRRAIVKKLLAQLPTPALDEIVAASLALWKCEEREFHYAAIDLLGIKVKQLDSDFLALHCEDLLTTKSWWDTVDGLGSAAISPLTVKYKSTPLMNKWNKSENIWLNRAAIQHQRGRREATDLDLLFKYCSYHSHSRVFWITKAIGWALRDVAAFDRPAVSRFLVEHPQLDPVAVREANKHLNK